MDDIDTSEYDLYYDAKVLIGSEELPSWSLDELLSAGDYDDSVSAEAASSTSMASKSIVMERNRRRKFNEKLFALRSVVPNITKMDKASIITDAIEYIENLQEQERSLKTEISQLEAEMMRINNNTEFECTDSSFTRKDTSMNSFLHQTYPSSTQSIHLVDLTVREVGEKIMTVSLTYEKRWGAMNTVCQLLDSLNLKIISSNITSVPGRLIVHTLFIETDETDNAMVKGKIEKAICKNLICDSGSSITSASYH